MIAYITEQGCSISREGERLIIKKGGTVLHALHIFKLDQLVLYGNVTLTPAAMSYLLAEGVDTVFMTFAGRYRGRLQPPHSKNITLRREQFRRLSDPQVVLGLAQKIVAGKIANLRTSLLRLNRSRTELDLEDQILSLKRLAEKTGEAADLDSLRGLEGRSAVVYFQGFSRGFLADGVTFEKRVRRPPTDPVNALLSLGYTLLFNSVMAAVSMVGFDPYLGALHSVEYGRPSLPLDLMEEWRPVIVDALVLSVFNTRVITLQDFIFEPVSREQLEAEGEGRQDDWDADLAEGDDKPSSVLPVRLTNTGFRKYLAQFERKMADRVRYHLSGQHLSYRDCIREQVRHFARVIRGEDQVYQSMLWR